MEKPCGQLLEASMGWSEMISPLSVDSGEIPESNGLVGGSNPNCEIISLLDGKLARSSSVSCIPRKEKKRKRAFIGLPIRINDKRSQTPILCKFHCHTFQACTCIITVYNVCFGYAYPNCELNF